MCIHICTWRFGPWNDSVVPRRSLSQACHRSQAWVLNIHTSIRIGVHSQLYTLVLCFFLNWTSYIVLVCMICVSAVFMCVWVSGVYLFTHAHICACVNTYTGQFGPCNGSAVPRHSLSQACHRSQTRVLGFHTSIRICTKVQLFTLALLYSSWMFMYLYNFIIGFIVHTIVLYYVSDYFFYVCMTQIRKWPQ